MHEGFANGAAGELGGEAGFLGDDPTVIRARVLRLAADVAPQEAATMTREGYPPMAQV